MTEQPLVTIIIPFYNVARYIDRCAESLFAQSYRNLELVFVNDASQDVSVDILNNVLEKYCDSHCKAKVIDNKHVNIKGPHKSH